MGYYSDVMVSTTREGFEHLKAKTHGTCEDHLFGGYGYELALDEGDSVVFGWKGVKWYPTFPEVAALMNGLDELEEMEIPYEYVEVGEDGATDRRASGDYDDYDDRLENHIEAYTTVQIWR